VEIRHKFKGLGYFDYLLSKSDTLEFIYFNGKPFLRSLSKQTRTFNFDYLLDSLIHKGKPANFLKYQIDHFFLPKEYGYPKTKKDFDSLLRSFKSKYKKLALADFEKEEFLLDSIKEIDAVSKLQYKFYKNRLFFKREVLNLEEQNYTSFDNFFQNDSLLKFSFYRDYIDQYTKQVIQSTIPLVETKTSKNRDARVIFDLIIINTSLSKKTKEYLLFKSLEEIVNHKSYDEIKPYFQKFKSMNFNENLISYFNEQYNLKDSILNDLKLEDYSGNHILFSELLQNNKEKIIYLDFWASWCAPCIKAMPVSKSLREQLNSKDIVFIYLAFNDRKKFWINVSKKVELFNYRDSYIIINSKTNKITENLNIETLPRYIIYGKDNKLLYQNAPGPESEEIHKILVSLLADE
jgi:thiol-disulfide isomerase/thioredoxin